MSAGMAMKETFPLLSAYGGPLDLVRFLDQHGLGTRDDGTRGIRYRAAERSLTGLPVHSGRGGQEYWNC